MNPLVIHTPDWVKDAVFYQVFPDRFASSTLVPKPSNLEAWDAAPTAHGYKGGDLLGVLEHLDHIASLGCNAIYLNPIFQSGSNHRYHTHDYLQVDPMLGGNAALRQLLDAAHARGIRVILDGVFNHASRGFLQFHDILENGPDSAYLDWFHIEQFPLRPYSEKEPPGYKTWWGYPALPKFNTNSIAVREYLWSVAEYWIKFGIDGWRLDVPNEIDDDEFWREFRRRVKAANPEAYLVGEIWDAAERWLQGDQFDATMNYVFTRLVTGFFGGASLNHPELSKCGLKDTVALTASEFADGIQGLLDAYPWEVTLAEFNLLDSHDTPRFITSVNGDDSAYRLATLFQMTFPGAPCIYYGSEVGLDGGQDPDCRKGMPWDTDAWDKDRLAFTRAAVALREAVPALRRGRYRPLVAQGLTFGFERHLETQGSWAVVLLNADTRPRDFQLAGLTDGVYHDYFSKRAYLVRNGTVVVDGVPPRSGAVLVKDA